jgi:hypothetical protein
VLDLSDHDAAAIAQLAFAPGGGAPVALRLHEKSFALEELGRYFNVHDPDYWRDDSEGARERLLARLEAGAAPAEDAAQLEDAENSDLV